MGEPSQYLSLPTFHCQGREGYRPRHFDGLNAGPERFGKLNTGLPKEGEDSGTHPESTKFRVRTLVGKT